MILFGRANRRRCYRVVSFVLCACLPVRAADGFRCLPFVTTTHQYAKNGRTDTSGPTIGSPSVCEAILAAQARGAQFLELFGPITEHVGLGDQFVPFGAGIREIGLHPQQDVLIS